MPSRRTCLRVAVAGLLSACGRPPATRAPMAAPTLFAAPGGAAWTPADALAAMQASDVVLLGERHGHPSGLALLAELVEALFAGPAGKTAALALESVTRDRQAPLDAYLRGEIDEAAMRAGAELEGERRFPEGHRRMVAAAKRAGRPVLAANAPRALVTRARTEGLEALRELPPDQRALVDVPAQLTEGRYRDEFFAAIGGGHEVGDRAALEGFYRAQNVWDATMAGTIARALAGGLRPVVQVVGSFHVDFGGGLLQRVREAEPAARVWTLSVVDVDAAALRPEDRERADLVAYAGPFEGL